MNNGTGVLGVHSLDHFSLTVPGLDAAVAFYGRFGLETRAAGAECELLASGSVHRWGRVRGGFCDDDGPPILRSSTNCRRPI